MNRHPHLVGIGYVVAFILIAFPLVDLAANIWPWNLGQVNWRYGSYGLASGYVLTVVLGFGLLLTVAALGGQRNVMRAFSAICLVGGVVLALAAAAYVLDALQIQGTISGDARSNFRIGTGKSLFKNGLTGLAFLYMGWAGWRGSAGVGKDVQKRGKEKPLVSGVS
jgi:hypothetical protein